MYTLTLPLGTTEYVVQTVDRSPADRDLSTLAAQIAVTAEDDTADPVYAAASWFPGETGYGKLVDTADLGAGAYLVRTKVTAGLETILLGPNRLVIA